MMVTIYTSVCVCVCVHTHTHTHTHTHLWTTTKYTSSLLLNMVWTTSGCKNSDFLQCCSGLY